MWSWSSLEKTKRTQEKDSTGAISVKLLRTGFEAQLRSTTCGNPVERVRALARKAPRGSLLAHHHKASLAQTSQRGAHPRVLHAKRSVWQCRAASLSERRQDHERVPAPGNALLVVPHHDISTFGGASRLRGQPRSAALRVGERPTDPVDWVAIPVSARCADRGLAGRTGHVGDCLPFTIVRHAQIL